MRLITEDEKPELVELLLKLMEESSEVTQAASKLIRFGLVGKNPKDVKTNVQNLSSELSDLLAIIHLITNELKINIKEEDISSPEILKEKINRFSEYSVYWKHLNECTHI